MLLLCVSRRSGSAQPLQRCFGSPHWRRRASTRMRVARHVRHANGVRRANGTTPPMRGAEAALQRLSAGRTATDT